MMRLFHDRADAGHILALELREYSGRTDLLVLALPRGGVPVALEVARALDAPMDVFLVRKLGVPGHEELAMGAIASGGVVVLNDDVIERLRISREMIDAATDRELKELERRETVYRGDRSSPQVDGRTIILVDDGLATGSTMRAAAGALSRQKPERIVVAVPVAAAQTCRELQSYADEVVCAFTPEPFYAVGLWYQDFSPTTDAQVRAILQKAYARQDEEAARAAGANNARATRPLDDLEQAPG